MTGAAAGPSRFNGQPASGHWWLGRSDHEGWIVDKLASWALVVR